jgi:hypothetical protein
MIKMATRFEQMIQKMIKKRQMKRYSESLVNNDMLIEVKLRSHYICQLEFLNIADRNVE